MEMHCQNVQKEKVGLIDAIYDSFAKAQNRTGSQVVIIRVHQIIATI